MGGSRRRCKWTLASMTSSGRRGGRGASSTGPIMKTPTGCERAKSHYKVFTRLPHGRAGPAPVLYKGLPEETANAVLALQRAWEIP